VEDEAMNERAHRRREHRAAALAVAALLAAAPAFAQLKGTENGDWRYWGGDERSSRYSPLAQVDASNAGKLEVAWRWYAANYGPEPDFIFRCTPIKVGNRLFAVAGQRRTVVSIDPATGETLWMWRM
jgi:quinoprotein glucose dehydrogenase